jgi:hypothetical protein
MAEKEYMQDYPDGIKWGPNETDRLEFRDVFADVEWDYDEQEEKHADDGKDYITLEGLTRLLIQKGARYKEELDRFVAYKSKHKELYAEDEWRRFEEAINIARADLEAQT